MIPEFIFLLILLFLSGFFSAVETAFTSLSPVQIQELKKRHNQSGAIVENLHNNADKLLTTILIGNNLTNISISVISSAITIRAFGSTALGITTAVLTMLILIFGEILPKHLAIRNNETICINTAGIIKALSIIFLPLIWLTNSFTALFISRKNSEGRNYFSRDSLLMMMKYAENTGVIEQYKTKMVESVFRFSDLTVHAVMTHRQEVFSINQNLPVEQAIPEVIASGFSRIPVYADNPEVITGIVLTKDLIRASTENRGGNQSKTTVSALASPPIFIPETWKINRVFLKLKSEILNLAVVLDEYGGLAGIVTMEDLVEEIIGELYDENEEPDEAKIRKSHHAGWYTIRGDTPIHLLEEVHGSAIIHDRNCETAGGYILQQLSALPVKDQKIETDIGTFIIHSMNKKRVHLLDYLPSKKNEPRKQTQ